MGTHHNSFSTLGFIQLQMADTDPANSLQTVLKILESDIPPPGSLIVLPELWSSGFAYRNLDYVAEQNQHILHQLRTTAERYSIVIGGSLVEKSTIDRQSCYYNTLWFVGGNSHGSICKQNLFPLISEDRWFSSKNGALPVTTTYGVAGGLICYDIRFPETARRMCSLGADVLVVSAQWPTARIDHWQTLLRARAIENQIYTVACNAVGTCLGVPLGGRSMVIDPTGQVVLDGGVDEGIFYVAVDGTLTAKVRSQFNTTGSTQQILPVEKCISSEKLLQYLSLLNKAEKKTVFCEVTQLDFPDIITRLTALREKCDFLVVGLRIDEHAAHQNTIGCGVQPEKLVASLAAVDLVIDLSTLSHEATVVISKMTTTCSNGHSA